MALRHGFLVILSASALAAPAHGRTVTAFMPLGIEADAPRGFVAMCQRDRAACGAESGMVAPVPFAAAPPESVEVVLTARALPDWAKLSPAAALPQSFAIPATAVPQPAISALTAPPRTAKPSDSGLVPSLSASTLALPNWLPALEFVGNIMIAVAPGLPEWVTASAAAAVQPPAPPIVVAAVRAHRNADPLKLLRQINRKVNGRVRQRADDRTIAGGDSWQEAGKARWATGDCEDIALQKRRELLEAGFAPRKLFLAVAFVRGIGLHTVLMGRTDKGDFVLDSMTPYVTHWSKVGYSWLRIQSGNNPMDWRTLGRGTPVQLAALSVGSVPGVGR